MVIPGSAADFGKFIAEESPLVWKRIVIAVGALGVGGLAAALAFGRAVGLLCDFASVVNEELPDGGKHAVP